MTLTPPVDPAPHPRWTDAELAWPLALLAGFVGTWLGLEAGLPGVAAVLATLGFAPLYAGLIAHGLGYRAGLVTLGWMGAIAVATAGVVLERGLAATLSGLPLAEAWFALRIEPWLAEGGLAESGAPGEGPGGGSLLAVGVALLLPALLGLIARFAAGIPALLGLALATGVMAGGSGRLAVALVERGRHPLEAVGLSWPPQAVAVLTASALWITVAAGRRPGDARPPEFRSLVAWGTGLALLGALGELLGHGPWLRWVVRLAGA